MITIDFLTRLIIDSKPSISYDLCTLLIFLDKQKFLKKRIDQSILSAFAAARFFFYASRISNQKVKEIFLS